VQWPFLGKEKTNTRRSNWVPLKEIMLGLQEGIEEKRRGRISYKKKKIRKFKCLSPHPHAHDPPLTVFCPEEKSLSRNGCFY